MSQIAATPPRRIHSTRVVQPSRASSVAAHSAVSRGMFLDNTPTGLTRSMGSSTPRIPVKPATAAVCSPASQRSGGPNATRRPSTSSPRQVAYISQVGKPSCAR